MAGSPTEIEVQTQLQNAIDILEKHRVYADAVATASGELDVLEQSLEGEFTPAAVANAAESFRAGIASVITPAAARSFLDPIIQEYGKIIDNDSGGDTFGGGYTDVFAILEAMYEFFVAQTPDTTLETRGITFGTPSAVTGTGDGSLRRLTVDENAFELEACRVEKKHFRCRQDANSGTEEEAEIFEVLGQKPSFDALLQGETGSGVNVAIASLNAGTGQGGSLLNNGSFSEFTSGAAGGTDPKFTGWFETFSVMTTTGVTSSTTVYRSHPGESTALSCELTVTGGSTNRITLKQTLPRMATSSLNPNRPYFLRVMIKDGSTPAAGGTINMRLGSQTVSLTASDATSAWQELIIPLDTNTWFKNFNEDTFDVEIEWTGGTGGSVLFDDMIFQELTLIDGTYWVLTMDDATPVRWLVDDIITATDSFDVSIGNGTIQYWIQYAYGRYLPHTSGTPRILDP